MSLTGLRRTLQLFHDTCRLEAYVAFSASDSGSSCADLGLVHVRRIQKSRVGRLRVCGSLKVGEGVHAAFSMYLSVRHSTQTF